MKYLAFGNHPKCGVSSWSTPTIGYRCGFPCCSFTIDGNKRLIHHITYTTKERLCHRFIRRDSYILAAVVYMLVSEVCCPKQPIVPKQKEIAQSGKIDYNPTRDSNSQSRAP